MIRSGNRKQNILGHIIRSLRIIRHHIEHVIRRVAQHDKVIRHNWQCSHPHLYARASGSAKSVRHVISKRIVSGKTNGRRVADCAGLNADRCASRTGRNRGDRPRGRAGRTNTVIKQDIQHVVAAVARDRIRVAMRHGYKIARAVHNPDFDRSRGLTPGPVVHLVCERFHIRGRRRIQRTVCYRLAPAQRGGTAQARRIRSDANRDNRQGLIQRRKNPVVIQHRQAEAPRDVGAGLVFIVNGKPVARDRQVAAANGNGHDGIVGGYRVRHAVSETFLAKKSFGGRVDYLPVLNNRRATIVGRRHHTNHRIHFAGGWITDVIREDVELVVRAIAAHHIAIRIGIGAIGHGGDRNNAGSEATRRGQILNHIRVGDLGGRCVCGKQQIATAGSHRDRAVGG